jgi:hypothetical protein
LPPEQSGQEPRGTNGGRRAGAGRPLLLARLGAAHVAWLALRRAVRTVTFLDRRTVPPAAAVSGKVTRMLGETRSLQMNC